MGKVAGVADLENGNGVYEVWQIAQSETKFRRNDELVMLPQGWVFVPRGDAALTRRIKAQPEYWIVVTHYRQRKAAAGLCAPASVVERIRADLEAERNDPKYGRRLEQGREYRARREEAYREDFRASVIAYLHFRERWSELAVRLADAVTEHATPVGSGTVARTQRISVGERAEAAVIAWMRHQTSAYDRMYILNIKGERREVRRRIAEVSRRILDKYRTSDEVDLAACPLAKALGIRVQVSE